jgi:hypothetical protein
LLIDTSIGCLITSSEARFAQRRAQRVEKRNAVVPQKRSALAVDATISVYPSFAAFARLAHLVKAPRYRRN